MKTSVSVFRFQPVTLYTDTGDDKAVLVFNREQLIAVLTRLSALHDALQGQWFLEAAFHVALGSPSSSEITIFDSEAHFESWALDRLSGDFEQM